MEQFKLEINHMVYIIDLDDNKDGKQKELLEKFLDVKTHYTTMDILQAYLNSINSITRTERKIENMHDVVIKTNISTT